MERKILLTDCPDAKGLIAKITNICYKHQLNIIKYRLKMHLSVSSWVMIFVWFPGAAHRGKAGSLW